MPAPGAQVRGLQANRPQVQHPLAVLPHDLHPRPNPTQGPETP